MGVCFGLKKPRNELNYHTVIWMISVFGGMTGFEVFILDEWPAWGMFPAHRMGTTGCFFAFGGLKRLFSVGIAKSMTYL